MKTLNNETINTNEEGAMKGRLTFTGNAVGSVVERPTLDSLRAMVSAAGFKVAPGWGCWEKDEMMYASSLKVIPGCYGHPRYEVSWRLQ